MGNKCIECKCNNNDTTDLSKETNFTNKKENIKNDIDKTQEDLLLNSNTKSDRKPSFAEKFSNFKKEKEKSKKSILEIKEETKEENLESKRSKQKNPISQLKFIDEMSQ